jgi:hypothetical protein
MRGNHACAMCKVEAAQCTGMRPVGWVCASAEVQRARAQEGAVGSAYIVGRLQLVVLEQQLELLPLDLLHHLVEHLAAARRRNERVTRALLWTAHASTAAQR